MILFQVFAVALLLLIVILDGLRLTRRSSSWLGFLFRTFIWLMACIFILVPDVLTYIANALGIGRGANLLLYLLTLAFIAVSFLLYARIVQLQRQMTQLVRHLALAHPLAPANTIHSDSASCCALPST